MSKMKVGTNVGLDKGKSERLERMMRTMKKERVITQDEILKKRIKSEISLKNCLALSYKEISETVKSQ